MVSGGYGPVLRQVGRLLGGGAATGLGEGQLLRRFAVDRDEAAFEALVARHGPMVLGTCRRLLADPHDVEDAFQATFLVLAKKAGSIRDAGRLGPWLHGVARRVATRSRALAARRAARERPGAEDRAINRADPAEAVELRSALDEELARLPEKYRAPLVLCYLDGLTHDEAASQLNWPVGTVRSRLAGGRDRLRSRLTRRGLAPSATAPALLPAAKVSEVLMSSTIRIATAAGPAPAHVASLAKGALVAMMWSKWKAIAAVGLMAGLTVGGVAAQQGGEGKAQGPAEAPKAGPNDLAEFSKERERLRQELALLNKGMELIRFESDQRLRELEAKAQEIRTQLDQSDQRWRDLVRKFPSATADAPTPKGEAPPSPPVIGPSPPAAAPGADRPAPPTTVTELGTGVVLVTSGKRDRVTVLDTKTGERKTCRFPGTLTELTPIVGPNMLAFMMNGPDLRRIAVYDFQAKAWSSVDLREPASGQISPLVGTSEVSYDVNGNLYVYGASAKKWGILEGAHGAGFSRDGFIGGNNLMAPVIRGREIKQIRVMEIDTGKDFPQDLREPASGELASMVIRNAVAYQAGRFVYVFSAIEKTWSVLELKQAAPVLDAVSMGGAEEGKLMIPDGDLIHLYDARTGEWTHLDTKDEK